MVYLPTFGIFTYIWLISMVNVRKYTYQSHGDPMGYKLLLRRLKTIS